jgi:glycerol-3-phosphate acyltransferase PlsY
MSIAGSVVLLIAAYAAGAIPFGVVLGKLLHGSDLRDIGSGSTGTTNALRAYGPKISAIVLLCDVLKGAVPVVAARWLDADPWIMGAAGVLAVVGHCWSPFIEFDGGKGVATGGGALIAYQPWAALGVLLMVVVVLLTRYVSLGSIISAVSIGIGLTIAAIWDRESPAVALSAIAIAGIIVWRHRQNIDRLIHGSERRVSFRANTSASTT